MGVVVREWPTDEMLLNRGLKEMGEPALLRFEGRSVSVEGRAQVPEERVNMDKVHPCQKEG